MSFEISIHITSSCYITTVYFRINLNTKMEGAVTDKLSSCTMDEGACAELTNAETVWKQWQSAVQWSGRTEKPLLSETDTHTYPQTG